MSHRRGGRHLAFALGFALTFSLFGAGAASAYPTLPATIWTIAGDGTFCARPTGICGDGPDATAAQLRVPSGVDVDAAGNVYIADEFDHKVRKLTPAGRINDRGNRKPPPRPWRVRRCHRVAARTRAGARGCARRAGACGSSSSWHGGRGPAFTGSRSSSTAAGTQSYSAG